MVRLTRAGEYAIRGMLYLSKQSGDRLTLISEIAAAQEVSASFLAKVFQNLTKAGLVHSQRGAAGGVSLGRPADRISLKDIIEAIEGPFALNECLLPEDPCRNRDDCPLSAVWGRAQEKMVEVLADVTLDGLNSPGKAM